MNPKKKAELQHLLDQKLEELSRKRKQPHVIPEPTVLGVDGEIFRNFDTLTLETIAVVRPAAGFYI